jgi:hypothetical protein
MSFLLWLVALSRVTFRRLWSAKLAGEVGAIYLRISVMDNRDNEGE